MRACLAGLLVFLLLAPVVQAKSAPRKKRAGASSRKASATHKTGKSAKSRRRVVPRQTQPDPERTREIQEALRREGYFSGPATGRWDEATRDAMARYQRGKGHPATGKPDARSLIKLGLGPKYEDVLQPPSSPAPESAAPAPPAPPPPSVNL